MKTYQNIGSEKSAESRRLTLESAADGDVGVRAADGLEQAAPRRHEFVLSRRSGELFSDCSSTPRTSRSVGADHFTRRRREASFAGGTSAGDDDTLFVAAQDDSD